MKYDGGKDSVGFFFRCQASCVAVATAIALMLQKKPNREEDVENIIRQSHDYAKEVLQNLHAEVKCHNGSHHISFKSDSFDGLKCHQMVFQK